MSRNQGLRVRMGVNRMPGFGKLFIQLSMRSFQITSIEADFFSLSIGIPQADKEIYIRSPTRGIKIQGRGTDYLSIFDHRCGIIFQEAPITRIIIVRSGFSIRPGSISQRLWFSCNAKGIHLVFGKGESVPVFHRRIP